MNPAKQITRGIRWKMLSTMIVLLTVFLVILTAIVMRGQSRVMQRALDRELEQQKAMLVEKGRTLSRNLRLHAENDIASYSFSSLSDALTTAVREHRDLAFAILMDTKRVALIHTAHAELHQEELRAREDMQAAAEGSSTYFEYGSGAGAVMEFVEPIYFGTQRWGTLRLGYSLHALNQEMIKARREMAQQILANNLRSAGIAAGFLVVSTLVVLWRSQKLTEPIIRLTQSARRLAEGDFSVVDGMEVKTQDEVGFLFDAFITMAENVKEQTQQLRQLTDDYQGLIERAPEGVLVHCMGLVTYANAAACNALGVEGPASLLGSDLLNWVVPADRIMAFRVLRGGESTKGMEWRFRGAGDKVVIMEVIPVEAVPFGGIDSSMILTRDVTARRELEREIVQISTKEQERFAHDLHDGLGQVLTGIAYRGKMLEQFLRDSSSLGAEQALEIVAMANQASSQARTLAQGLDPVELSEEGLGLALNALAHRAKEIFDVSCEFESNSPPLLYDKFISTHLYRIAQEAVTNAVKHGKPSTVSIELNRINGEVVLTVRDDGLGIPDDQVPETIGGAGLRNMSYRARMIGGSLKISQNDDGGTTITCRYPDRTPVDLPTAQVIEHKQTSM